MQTVPITIEDTTFADLAAAARTVGLTPAEYVRRATEAALQRHKARDAARRDLAGYAAHPPADDEFAVVPADLTGPDDAAW